MRCKGEAGRVLRQIRPISEPLPGFHQSKVQKLLAVPCERRGIVPVKAGDVEGRPRIGFQRFCRAERHDGCRQVVMPGAGIGVVFFDVEQMVFAQLQALLRLEDRNPVDPAAARGNMFLKAPAQPAALKWMRKK